MPIILPFFLVLLFLTFWLVDVVHLIFLALILRGNGRPTGLAVPLTLFPAPPRSEHPREREPDTPSLDRARQGDLLHLPRERDGHCMEEGEGAVRTEWAVLYSRPRPCLTHLFSPNGNNLVHIKRLCGTVGGEGGRQYELLGIRRCESY